MCLICDRIEMKKKVYKEEEIRGVWRIKNLYHFFCFFVFFFKEEGRKNEPFQSEKRKKLDGKGGRGSEEGGGREGEEEKVR